MEEDTNGQEAAQDAQQQERPQEQEAQQIAAIDDASTFEAQIAERDTRIAELEEQIAEADRTDNDNRIAKNRFRAPNVRAR